MQFANGLEPGLGVGHSVLPGGLAALKCFAVTKDVKFFQATVPNTKIQICRH
jgi:hypothetical protein